MKKQLREKKWKNRTFELHPRSVVLGRRARSNSVYIPVALRLHKKYLHAMRQWQRWMKGEQ